MKSSIFSFNHVHLLGESATHPMALCLPHHTALLRLAGSSPLRCRALSGTPITAPSGATNCHFQVIFAPKRTGIGKYTGEMAAWLAAQGHDLC
ncbi:MAG: hypothetical protein GZ085_13420 [Sulfuriferula multivorans]|uniref:Uncharacterized protein n=1 Tax=Sulfuriferula multivorans TaxID=1559896 RepID=A0A7C9P9J4_9PROT|nr:hypothetical protein [Sulfuriferula multivorans]